MTWGAVDLFAGPGGWDVAARSLGMNVIGVEWDARACDTRRAAGLETVQGDVTAYGPKDFPAGGLIASPPCQTFSAAGKGTGRRDLEAVLAAVRERDWSDRRYADPRTALVLQPLRWALEAIDADIPYAWLAWEQVPGVLPVWQAMADVLRAEGYMVDAGKLSAEQYGVPQTRKRAVLVARYRAPVRLPAPTHRLYRKGVAQREGDPALRPWVSMAETLGWGMSARPMLTFCAGGGGNGDDLTRQRPADRALRREMAADRWTFRQSAQARATERDATEPAPTITAGHDHGEREWVLRSNYGTSGDPAARGERTGDEPSPAVTSKAGRNVWNLRNNSSAHDPTVSGSQYGPETAKVTERQAAIFQTFPPDYPWRGTEGQRFQQIGNAVPPLLARAVLLAATGSGCTR